VPIEVAAAQAQQPEAMAEGNATAAPSLFVAPSCFGLALAGAAPVAQGRQALCAATVSLTPHLRCSVLLRPRPRRSLVYCLLLLLALRACPCLLHWQLALVDGANGSNNTLRAPLMNYSVKRAWGSRWTERRRKERCNAISCGWR
jgi:hypothetical protein